MGTIIVTGVPGVGKTTVVTEAAEKVGLEVVVYGTEMFRVAKAKGLVEHRDEMRKLSPKTQREIQQAAAEAIAEKGRVIVDTHCMIQTPKGFLPGLPEWVVRGLEPETVVLIETDAEAIAARRAADETRERDEDPVEAIDLHQGLNRAAAASVATLTGATVARVRNEEGQVDEAVASLIQVLE
ncbi:MAG: adenylate kinase [Candidatus Thermoplasmatota archaeon]|nr:adenylate kinase [Candidatus Thermoplasmatota archaeon]